MNQYIITEELLQEAMENTTWGRTNQQKFRDKLTPYQSERDTISKELALELCMDARKDVREKVLDEIIGMFDNGNYNGVTVKQMIAGKFKEIELRAGEQ